MFAENRNFYQTAANAVITGLLWHCCPFSSGGAGRDKRQRVLFCGFAWRLGVSLPSPSVDGREGVSQWYGGRLRRSVCGNGIGTILLLGLAGKILLDGMLELRIFSEIICRFMLPATPVWVLSLVLLLVGKMRRRNGMSKNGVKSSFFWSQFPCFWCFWRWRLLRSMRVFCRLPCLLLRASGQGLQR